MLFLTCLLSLLSVMTKSELKFVLEIFRHGSRYTLDSPENPGELTNVGQRQHFLLGTQLRKEYIGEKRFLNPIFNQTEFNVISTDVNRTIQSAQSQLLGFYPLETGQSIPENLVHLAVPAFNNLDIDIKALGLKALPKKFSPVPIHTDDSQLSMAWGQPSFLDRITAQTKTDVYKKFLALIQPTINTYKQVSNQPWDDKKEPIFQLWNVLDNVHSKELQGEAYPDYLKNNPELARNMTFVHEIGFYLCWFQNQEYQSYFVKGFYDRLEESLEKSWLFGKDLKWQMLSAHDYNIANIHTTLNITNYDCIYREFYHLESEHMQCEHSPKYTSNLLFEFYDDQDKGKQVKVRYDGKYVYLCEKKDYYCQYEEFMSRIHYFLGKQEKQIMQ